MNEIKRIQTSKRLSQGVEFGNLVFLAGQVDSSKKDVAGQTTEILRQIEALLQQAGSDRSRILSATIWLADISGYTKLNEIWDEWIPAGSAPARACIEARLARPEFLVEIAVIAARAA